MSNLDDAAEPLGRRERKKKETRLALKTAALDLVAQRGFSHVTVEDIADAADVSVRTFFNYFDSKEAAVVGHDPEVIEELQRALEALPAELSPLDAVRTVMLARLRTMEEAIDASGESPEAWQRRFELVQSQPEVMLAYTRYLTVLESALTEGLLHRLGDDDAARPYAALVAASAMAVMRTLGACATPISNGARSAMAASAFDTLAAGLQPTTLAVGGAR